MPYKPTGRPPGRPRKDANPLADQVTAAGENAQQAAIQDVKETTQRELSRAREGFRRAAGDPADALYRPPRRGSREKQHVGRRPLLHPNVIAKAE